MSKSNDKLTSEQLLRIVLDTIPLRVFWKDKDSRFLGGNQLFLSDLGISDISQLIGKSDYEFAVDPKQAEHFIQDDQEVMRLAMPKLDIEETQFVPGKTPKWLRTNKAPLINSQGDIIGVMGTYQDITAQVEYRQQIEKQAMLDPLTGLANRRKLENVLVKHKAKYVGLMFIDLDFFKAVNDSLGHDVGDILLEKVGKRLLDLVTDVDQALVTKLGGEEFGILVPFQNADIASESLEALAAQVVKALIEPFTIEHHIVNLGASVGVTIVNKEFDNPTMGFQEADMAMYAAKAKGRNNFQFYHQSMKEAADRKHQLIYCLHHAIENNEFTLAYQSQINDSGKLIGAEALLRWHSQQLGSVPPDEFIELAEESGFIHKIGEWVLNTALDDVSNWLPKINDSNFKIAVNFSNKQFQDKHLVSAVEKALQKRNIPAHHLQIEITESVLIGDKEAAIRSMLRLQRLGISIAIDDFGTGYSSLSYLAILPIDKLKIDRAFVTNLQRKSTNRKLVDTLVHMSKNLQMEVIAEGVETLDERNTLIELGCFQFQGYYFSKPISNEEFQATYFTKKQEF